MIRALAVCVARCGWHGLVLTGWVPITLEEASRESPVNLRPRGNGERLEVRRRLRSMPCPQCSYVGLERAAPAAATDALIRRSVALRRMP
jgi:hypothetical protein